MFLAAAILEHLLQLIQHQWDLVYGIFFLPMVFGDFGNTFVQSDIKTTKNLITMLSVR